MDCNILPCYLRYLCLFRCFLFIQWQQRRDVHLAAVLLLHILLRGCKMPFWSPINNLHYLYSVVYLRYTACHWNNSHSVYLAKSHFTSTFVDMANFNTFALCCVIYNFNKLKLLYAMVVCVSGGSSPAAWGVQYSTPNHLLLVMCKR